ncbi:response regulator [Marinobacter sp. F3R08]|uniref:response regulator n=1 Tax=Marinobacter sp. F3R08 TaxID=2841559 RepID=UPI001C088C18|nr:response regulator [Marinobacter sp. F3R08]MBU2954817.1 response regulator [Marinobacter sp. F3R08]
MKPFSNLRLTSKIVMLVTLLGALAVIIMLYSMTSLYTVSRNYQTLLEKDAQASLLISAALLDLSDSSKMVLSVLTQQEVAKMRATQAHLATRRAQFNSKLRRISPLLNGVNPEFESLKTQEQALFSLADDIIDSAARWRGDKALKIIQEEFEPQLNAMRQNMDNLKDRTISNFQDDSLSLNQDTQNTITNTTLLFTLVLLSAVGFSAYLAFTRVSRPISHLTRAMQQLTSRNYHQTIRHTERQDEVGEMAKALEVFRDNMQRADQLEAEAAASTRARELAEQVAEAKANFLATMSHEIRTPMNAILGLAQISLRHSMEPRQKDRIEKILRTGQHLLGIINDILDFSSIDGGHVTPENVPFSPGELLNDVREMLAETAEKKGLQLEFKAHDCPAVLVGDPMRIRQILLNYTNNAIKFSDDGQINLRMEVQEHEDQSVYLYGEVTDQGIGLDKHQTESLFQPFQQADNSISRRFGGTGLGLAISRNLAELMGGTTGVFSEPGQGSRFWFRVKVRHPGTHECLPSADNEKNPVNAVNLRGLRLLLVDDNELNRVVAKELLMDEGILVDEASDGQQALELLESAPDQTYHMVLMDMMMPKLDGISTTRKLRENPRFKAIPIIAMTANASTQDVKKCADAGMNAHVSKPFDIQRLLNTLAEQQAATGMETAPQTTHAPAIDSDGAPMPPNSDILDPRPLEHLRSLVTPERFDNMLDLLIEDCRQRGEAFNAHAAKNETGTFRQDAHDLIGTSGHVGLNQLRDLGKALSKAIRDNDTRSALQLAQEIHQATLDADQVLRRHFKTTESRQAKEESRHPTS